MEHSEAQRSFFAKLITASVGIPGGGGRLAEAFAATPRERFVGPGPWRVFTAAGYIETPSDDPAFLYQDVTVAVEAEGQINRLSSGTISKTCSRSAVARRRTRPLGALGTGGGCRRLQPRQAWRYRTFRLVRLYPSLKRCNSENGDAT